MFYSDQHLYLIRDQLSYLKSLTDCINMNWMAILVGGSGSGKSSIVRLLAQLTGQKLKSLVVNSAMDTTEILGGFEQTDYNRHFEKLLEKVQFILTGCLKTKVSKGNICLIEKYQALIEKVQELSFDETETITMALATQLFLTKIEKLDVLVQEMRNLDELIVDDLIEIHNELDKLNTFVRQDECLNAGGKFEWIDSILVKCLQEGSWLLLDQVNLCSPAVLDRLNGLLEPNGVLSIGERGVDSDGNVVTIKPHKNFRLFLTMDPKYGEISRAMRNRGVEIFMLDQNENVEHGNLDNRSLLYNVGLTRQNHQEALMEIHQKILEDPANTGDLNVIQLLHTAFLIVQQISRGFPVLESFKSSCCDVYIKARSIPQNETKVRLMAIIDETIENHKILEEKCYLFDIDAATLSTKNLLNNSKLTLIRNQGLLLDWCINIFKKNSDNLNNFDHLIASILPRLNDSANFQNINCLKILPYILLNFYEHSTFDDIPVRFQWVSNILKNTNQLEFIEVKNKSLSETILNYDFKDQEKNYLWDTKLFSKANNLAIILYYNALIKSFEEQEKWKIKKSSPTITVAQFSLAHSEGKTTVKLKNQPLITDFIEFIKKVKNFTEFIINNNKKDLSESDYVHFRTNLKWFTRFCDLGDMILIKKSDKSQIQFRNIDEELALLFKVHYKWLKKSLKFLRDNHQEDLSNEVYRNEITQLTEMIDEINSTLFSAYEPFTKITKIYRKYTDIPKPRPSETAITNFSKMQNVSNSISPSKNQYITNNLSTELKFVFLHSKEFIPTRSNLITMWTDIFENVSVNHDDISEALANVNLFSEKYLNITDCLSALESLPGFDMSLTKDVENVTAKVHMWPIHEYLFILYCNLIMRQHSEDLINNTQTTTSSLYNYFINVPNIPTELLAALNVVCSTENKKDNNNLIYVLLYWCRKFVEQSYATKNFKQVMQWKFSTENSQTISSNSYKERAQDVFKGPILVQLISELLLNKHNNRDKEKSAFAMSTFGGCESHLGHLRLLNDLLWNNCAAINSNELNLEFNDWQVLKTLLDKFLKTSEQVEQEITNKNIEDNFLPGTKTLIKCEYLNPLQDLKLVWESLKSEDSKLGRGKAWILLGYLQSFIFGNTGYIDYIYKTKLKLKYVEEEIEDLESSVYVSTLFSRIAGHYKSNDLQQRFSEMKETLGLFKNERDSLRVLNAVRPENVNFISMYKKLSDFRISLGSYNVINKHFQNLNDSMVKLDESDDIRVIEMAKAKVREVEIWLESIKRFIDQLEDTFLSGYPDIIYPILLGLSHLRHGFKLISNEIERKISILETNYFTVDAETFIYNLVRFPTIGPKQENLLDIVDLCVSQVNREFLNFNLKSESKFTILQEQFRLTMNGLYELFNYISLNKNLSKTLWVKVNILLQQIVLIWRQQETEIEKEKQEKETLYKNKIQLKGDSLTEEEEINEEIQNIFPTFRDFSDIDSNMNPSLEQQKIIPESKESTVPLITEVNIIEVQNLHSNIVKHFVSSEWLEKKPNEAKYDFIQPLIQRYGTFGLLIDTLSPALKTELNQKLYLSLNMLTFFVSKINQGEELISNTTFNNMHKEYKPYDYYKDSNIEEVKQAMPLLDNILQRILLLLKEWSDHPMLLAIKIIIERIYSFAITSPVSRYLTGLELLLEKLHEWEANAHSDVSLSEYITAITQQIIAWRQLELACWKDCLNISYMKLSLKSSKWWFLLYNLFESYLTKNESKGEENQLSPESLIETLEKFITESSLVEYESRLDLLLTFHCHSYFVDESIERDQILAISWNIYKYYSQFVPEVQRKLNSIKLPIEKELKNFVKIARWNDISYWAVKEAVVKTHKGLHKFIKEYETNLREIVKPYLVLKTIQNDESITESKVNHQSYDIDPNNYTISTINDSNEVIVSKECEVINKLNFYLEKAPKLCKETILSSHYPGLRIHLEQFIEDFCHRSIRLKNLDIDRTLPQNKQKSLAKNILQQKKMALADYFKEITHLGLSYRLGNMAWKNQKDEIFNFLIPPLNLKTMIKTSFSKIIDLQILDQWEGCEKYFYQSSIKLNDLNIILSSGKSELDQQSIERCKGFSAHLMILANNQKKSLESYFKYFNALQSKIKDLLYLDTEDVKMKKSSDLKTEELKITTNLLSRQKDLWICTENLRQILITVQTTLEQILIYLQACPCENNTELYNIISHNLPMLYCKKGDETWEQANNYIQKSLQKISDIDKKFNLSFSNTKIFVEDKDSIFTYEHFNILSESFNNIKYVNDQMTEFASLLHSNSMKHPLSENINFIQQNIINKHSDFEKLKKSIISHQESIQTNPENSVEKENFNLSMNKLMLEILTVIQLKFKKNCCSEIEAIDDDKNEVENQDDESGTIELNGLKEVLVESVMKDVQELNLKAINEKLSKNLQNLYLGDLFNIQNNFKLLKKCLPILQQYSLLVEYYLNEQISSLRLTCKILYLQLNVFLELAKNGFCIPKDLDIAESEDGMEEKSSTGGMGLGDGEGQKDVSDKIESEDQLEEAKPAGQEKQNQEDKDCPEEDNGIEMSEDFDSKLQDVNNKSDNEDNSDDDNDDLDKQMGETADGADKLDEKIWGDDQNESENEEGNDKGDEFGEGEETGEKEFGAKDDNTTSNSEEKNNDKDSNQKDEQKEINEMEDQQTNEDQIDPYHGKHQPEKEPEPLDLPEDIDLDDGEKEDNQAEETNPFDIDEMKDKFPPENKENDEEEQNSEKIDNDGNNDNDGDSSSDEEAANETNDQLDKEDSVEEKGETENSNKELDMNEENAEPKEEDEKDDSALPSTIEANTQETGLEQNDERQGGSNDDVVNNTENPQTKNNKENNQKDWKNEKEDKGAGQSESDQQDSGHSGSSLQKSNPMVNKENIDKLNDKRKNPGKADENHLLAEKLEPEKKKLKTMIHSSEPSTENNEEEGAEMEDNDNEPDICQHIKNNEKVDYYATDAATEEQSREQASNIEKENELKENEEPMDVDMHDSEEEIDQETISKKESENLSNSEKVKKDKSKLKEKSNNLKDGEIETGVDIDGENVETLRIARGSDSSYHTNLEQTELEPLINKSVETKRLEVEKMLSQWVNMPTTKEATAAWNTLSSMTDVASRDLSEKLRLVLEPTQASRLKGDYRTGRRINMRKIIPYIASQFRKDKIWLRRTKPSKRDYQIILAIDDSSSMADNHSKELAFESLSLISKAMTYLEAGQLSVLKFGEDTEILHPLGETFNEQSGSRLMQEMRFQQKKTMISKLVNFSVNMFNNQPNSSNNAKLLVIISDGRGVLSEGPNKVFQEIKKARLSDIFIVFIIIDNPLCKNSILDIRQTTIANGQVHFTPFMDHFPFPFYMILRDINALPGVLSDALRQWFEIVGKIDT